MSRFERKVIREYAKLQKQSGVLLNAVNKLNEELLKVQLYLPPLEEEIIRLQTELKKWGPLAGYTFEEWRELNLPAGLQINLEAVIKMALDHQANMNDCYDGTRALYDEMNVLKEQIDDYLAAVEKFKKRCVAPLRKNHSGISLCFFEDNLQEFYSRSFKFFKEKKIPFTDAWNEYIDRYNLYMDKVSLLFDKTNELQEKLQEEDKFLKDLSLN